MGDVIRSLDDAASAASKEIRRLRKALNTSRKNGKVLMAQRDALQARIDTAVEGRLGHTHGGDGPNDDYEVSVPAGYENNIGGKRVALVLLGDEE